MYSVVLSYRLHPELAAIDAAHRLVLQTVATALRPLVGRVELQGTSDLAIEGRKFSGNSLRAKQHHLLYHGTLLYQFPLKLIGQCLAMPPRQPAYRRERGHLEFVTNLPAAASEIRQVLTSAFFAHQPLDDWPLELTRQLVFQRYARPEWNHQR
jgi:lipoate-protein ligase A